MKETIIIEPEYVSCILGANDKNISYIETLLERPVLLRGNSVSAENSDSLFSSLFKKLINEAKEKGELTQSDIFMEYQSLNDGEEKVKAEAVSIMNHSVYPKSNKQALLLNSFKSSQIVFAIGPAGTGKTFLSVAWALKQIFLNKKNKIIITRPVVEAGETLGFLPGDLSKKLDPYLKPLYDAMEALITPAHISSLENNGTIEIAPLAYMRGRSLNNALVILDEAQNATKAQIKMFLTRIGENSQAIITGDPTQIDLRHKNDSGLMNAVEILNEIEGISVVRFTHKDTVRSRIVREIIKAYEGNKDEIEK